MCSKRLVYSAPPSPTTAARNETSTWRAAATCHPTAATYDTAGHPAAVISGLAEPAPMKSVYSIGVHLRHNSRLGCSGRSPEHLLAVSLIPLHLSETPPVPRSASPQEEFSVCEATRNPGTSPAS